MLIFVQARNVFYLTQGDERKAEGCERIVGMFVVEDHPMCGQVEFAGFASFECRLVLAMEINLHILCEQQDAANRQGGFIILVLFLFIVFQHYGY